jgi:hypothetical protein
VKGRVFLLLLLLALTVPQAKKAESWGPNMHMWITLRALEEAGDSPITRVVKANLDAFFAGLMAPDMAVIYYYTNFETYKSTHSWSFLRELSKLAKTDEERAFVHGVALHLIQDAYAHNYFIPRKILQTQLQNAFIHPVVEGAVETRYLTPETMGSMTYIDRYLWMVNEATGRDWTYEAAVLKAAVAGGKFYAQAYTVPESDPLWNFYRGLAGFIGGLVDVSDAEADLEMAYQKTVEYLMYGTTPPLDPSGSSALAEADARLGTTTLLLRLGFSAIAGIIIYRFVLKGDLSKLKFWRRK